MLRGRERPDALVEPDGGLARLGADRLADHQRGRGGENEARPDGGRFLQEVQSACDIGVDEGLRGVAGDVGLVQRAGVDDRLEAMLAKEPREERAVGGRALDVGPGRGRDVEADDRVIRALRGAASDGGRASRPPPSAERASPQSAVTLVLAALAMVRRLRSGSPKGSASISKTSPFSGLIPSENDSVAVPKKCTCTSPGRRNSPYLK